nr:zinc finger protein 222-like [Onthophagus taurus]
MNQTLLINNRPLSECNDFWNQDLKCDTTTNSIVDAKLEIDLGEPTIFTPQILYSIHLETDPLLNNPSSPKNSSDSSVDHSTKEIDEKHVEVNELIINTSENTETLGNDKNLDKEQTQNHVCTVCGNQYNQLQELRQHQQNESHVTNVQFQTCFLSLSKMDHISCFEKIDEVELKQNTAGEHVAKMNIVVQKEPVVVSKPKRSLQTRRNDNEEYSHTCEMCGGGFSNDTTLWKHRIKENHLTPSSKEIHYQKMVSWIKEYNSYLSVVNYSQIYCKLCDKSLECSSKYVIAQHVRRSHNQADTKGKKGKVKKRSYRHKKRKLNCDKCNRKFKHMSSLNSHEIMGCEKQRRFFATLKAATSVRTKNQL